MFVNSKGFASYRRLIDLKKGIVGNDATICRNDGSLGKNELQPWKARAAMLTSSIWSMSPGTT